MTTLLSSSENDRTKAVRATHQFHSAIPIPTSSQDGSPRIQREHLLVLATALQTTLDVQALLDLFAEHVARLIPHDGMVYSNDDAGIDVEIGGPADHSCHYTLVLEQERLGQVSFTRSRQFSAAETLSMEILLANLVHPLRNALMYREALNAAARDPLTGVNNRAGFHDILDREVELARRHGTSFSLIMMDVDRFKTINDEHGHLVGDAALKHIVTRVQSCIRESDILFRYGGEEFCLVLSNTNLEGACSLAERVRAAVESLIITTSRTDLRVTASFGVASLCENDNSASLLEKTDAALYRAKALGRNRIATQES